MGVRVKQAGRAREKKNLVWFIASREGHVKVFIVHKEHEQVQAEEGLWKSPANWAGTHGPLVQHYDL